MTNQSSYDAIDLVVEPHHLTAEEDAELQQYIKEYREKHPLTEQEKEQMQIIAERIRAASRTMDHSG